MDEATAFWNAVAAEPGDDGPWLVFADWLQERGRPEAEIIRLRFGLSRIAVPDLPAADKRLDELWQAADAGWREEFERLWSLRPLLCRIEDILRMGHIPPREMFDRALSIVTLVVLAGTVRLGQSVVLPLEGGGVTVERVWGIETFGKGHTEIRAGSRPTPRTALAWAALAWPGHRVVDLGIRRGGLIREAE